MLWYYHFSYKIRLLSKLANGVLKRLNFSAIKADNSIQSVAIGVH